MDNNGVTHSGEIFYQFFMPAVAGLPVPPPKHLEGISSKLAQTLCCTQSHCDRTSVTFLNVISQRHFGGILPGTDNYSWINRLEKSGQHACELQFDLVYNLVVNLV